MPRPKKADTSGKPRLPAGTDWPPETEEWFAAWRDSDRTDGWDAPQWQFLFDTAVVHALVYGSQQFSWLQELRVREQHMGLGFAEGAPKEKEKAKVTPIERIFNVYQGAPGRKAEA